MEYQADETILFEEEVSESSVIVITNLRFIHGSSKSLKDPMILWFRLIDNYYFDDGSFYINAYTFRLFKKIIGERKNFMKKLSIRLNKEQSNRIIDILDKNIRNS